jgi:TPR repeat protein
MKSKSSPLCRILALSLAITAASVHSAESDLSSGSSQAAYEEVAAILKDPNADDDAKASAFLRMKALAEAGHVPAMAGLGYLYQEGVGTAKNTGMAAEWLQKAADKGHAISMFNLAGLLVRDQIPLAEGEKDRGRQYADGVEWYRKAAEAGLERARVGYGIILMRGDYGSKPDSKRAATFLIPAAEAGDLEAMNALGTLYEIGNGVPYSVPTAETWFRKAAEKGHLKARSNLSRVLDAYASTPQQRIEAIAWLILAEQEGDVVAKKIFTAKTVAVPAGEMAAARKEALRLRGLITAARKSSASAAAEKSSVPAVNGQP